MKSTEKAALLTGTGVLALLGGLGGVTASNNKYPIIENTKIEEIEDNQPESWAEVLYDYIFPTDEKTNEETESEDSFRPDYRFIPIMNKGGVVGNINSEGYTARPKINITDKLNIFADLFGDMDNNYLGELGAKYNFDDQTSINLGYKPNAIFEDGMESPEDKLFINFTKNFNQGGLVPPLSGPMSNGVGNLFRSK